LALSVSPFFGQGSCQHRKGIAVVDGHPQVVLVHVDPGGIESAPVKLLHKLGIHIVGIYRPQEIGVAVTHGSHPQSQSLANEIIFQVQVVIGRHGGGIINGTLPFVGPQQVHHRQQVLIQHLLGKAEAYLIDPASSNFSGTTQSAS
jgi:hypothetical protein